VFDLGARRLSVEPEGLRPRLSGLGRACRWRGVGPDEIGHTACGLAFASARLQVGDFLSETQYLGLRLAQGVGLFGEDGLLLAEQSQQFFLGLGSQSLHRSVYEPTNPKYSQA
jgi:hypothetical protein